MNYQNYNKINSFYLSNEMADAISSIVSQKENGNFVCKVLSANVKEHEGLVFVSPLDGYNPWGGGLNALSGAQIRAISKKYGKYVGRTIPAKNYSYIVVMQYDAYQALSKTSFKNYEDMQESLKNMCTFHIESKGIFNSKDLTQAFPYLEDFFNDLNKWRKENGRVTLDDDILKVCTENSLTNHTLKIEKKLLTNVK